MMCCNMWKWFLWSMMIGCALLACSEENEGREDETGFVPQTVDGKEIRFYRNKDNQWDWWFSVLMNEKGSQVQLDSKTVVLEGQPYTEYQANNDGTATFAVSFTYKTYIGAWDDYSYVTNNLTMTLKFVSEEEGIYQGIRQHSNGNSTGKETISGCFTLNGKSPTQEPGSEEEVQQPDKPEDAGISSDAIVSSISKISPTDLYINYTYDKTEAKQITQMGHCWSIFPHPTIEDAHTSPVKISSQGTGKGTSYCQLTAQPGSDYYVRAYALVDGKYVYFNELKFQSVGGDIKLGAHLLQVVPGLHKIVAEYEINKAGTFELICGVYSYKLGIGNESLGYVTRGKGEKIPEYMYFESCHSYKSILKEISTGIEYHSTEYEGGQN